MDAVKAKMSCHGIETNRYGQEEKQAHHKVKLGAVYGSAGENKDFADATPAGECWMMISPGRAALEFFKPGKNYYVTFTEAPD